MSSQQNNKTVTIIGGGLAGLTCAILLNRAGFEVTLVEKKRYPFHRVCGEYISNEVVPFLKSLNIDISKLNASNIKKLVISSASGKLYKSNLDLGGAGLSRYTFDNFLYQKASDEGVQFVIENKANSIKYEDGNFEIQLSSGITLNSSLAIAAYGKRSNLDQNRTFFYRRSPYLGVKYHIKANFPEDLIQLDNFEGGYCGTVKIEDSRYNLCYLINNRQLKNYGAIEEMERQVLFKNPILKDRFMNSDFLNEKPEVINEISFEQKPMVENHLLYCGDSAGMISPLCGNGMAMAIHAAKILSETIINQYPNKDAIEKNYQEEWKANFRNRLRLGQFAQRFFGNKTISEFAIKGLNAFPNLSQNIIKRTHGHPF